MDLIELKNCASSADAPTNFFLMKCYKLLIHNEILFRNIADVSAFF